MKTGVVLFSGGVDSTYTVARSVKDFDKLILLTYIVPGMVNEKLSSRSFSQLQKVCGDRLEHRIIDIKDFVNSQRGGALQCLQDNFKYKFLYSWCLGCKVAMHLYTIKFCKEHGIDCVLEGSNFYDAHALEQHKDVKGLLAEIYKTYGITLTAPYYYDESVHVLNANKIVAFLRFTGLYKDSTESRVKYLKKLGIDMGRGVFSQYRSTQPSCLMSLVFNAMRLPLKLIFKEQGGCCTLKYGYLNYISDKFFAQDAPRVASLRNKRASRPPEQPGKLAVYLDNNATTKLDPEVVRTMVYYQEGYVGNASSAHELGIKGKEIIEQARRTIAQKIMADPDEILFTSGGTESNNFAIKGMAFARQEKGRHIIISGVEHPSVNTPALWLKSLGFEISVLHVDAQGLVDPAEVARLIRSDTVLVSVMHANNEVGTIEPIADIGHICRKNGVYFHVDACQSFTKVDLDVDKQKLDMVSLSAHKIYGPGGVGALYVRKGTLITPLLHGGGQEQDMRSGTYHVSGIAGFGKAVEIATAAQVEQIMSLRDYGVSRLVEAGDVLLNGSRRNRLCNNINVTIKGKSGKEIVTRLSERGIYISTGAACSSRVLIPSGVLLAIGRSSDEALQAIRIGLSKWTTREEIDLLIDNLKDIVNA